MASSPSSDSKNFSSTSRGASMGLLHVARQRRVSNRTCAENNGAPPPQSRPGDAGPDEQVAPAPEVQWRLRSGRADHRLPALRQLVKDMRLTVTVGLASPFACPPEEVTASPEHACLPGAAGRPSAQDPAPPTCIRRSFE